MSTSRLSSNPMLDDPHYTPGKLIDRVKRILQCRSDADLARAGLEQKGRISQYRQRALPIGPAFLLRVMKKTGLSIDEVEILMGVEYERAD